MSEKMQADGKSSAKQGDATGGGKGSEKQAGAGESGGGAYPNPHTGTEGDASNNDPGSFLGHGGQSEIAWHGPGNLGDEAVDDETARKPD